MTLRETIEAAITKAGIPWQHTLNADERVPGCNYAVITFHSDHDDVVTISAGQDDCGHWLTLVSIHFDRVEADLLTAPLAMAVRINQFAIELAKELNARSKP
jgi:hypothetical protein